MRAATSCEPHGSLASPNQGTPRRAPACDADQPRPAAPLAVRRERPRLYFLLMVMLRGWIAHGVCRSVDVWRWGRVARGMHERRPGMGGVSVIFTARYECARTVSCSSRGPELRIATILPVFCGASQRLGFWDPKIACEKVGEEEV